MADATGTPTIDAMGDDAGSLPTSTLALLYVPDSTQCHEDSDGFLSHRSMASVSRAR